MTIVKHRIDKRFSRQLIFTASGTFTVPRGVTQAFVEVIGGGGGGRSGFSATKLGGAAGGKVDGLVTGLSAGDIITVTVGTGGTVNASGNPSSFGSYLSAEGGQVGSNTAAVPLGGLGDGTVPNMNIYPRCDGGVGPVLADGTSRRHMTPRSVVSYPSSYAGDGGLSYISGTPVGREGNDGQVTVWY